MSLKTALLTAAALLALGGCSVGREVDMDKVACVQGQFFIEADLPGVPGGVIHIPNGDSDYVVHVNGYDIEIPHEGMPNVYTVHKDGRVFGIYKPTKIERVAPCTSSTKLVKIG
jgi:hypothetical protein